MNATQIAHTVDEIESLPDGERAELIDGEIYDIATPTRTHQDITGGLYWKIRTFITDHKGACKVYAAPFAVYINNDDYSYVEPDVSVICDPDKLDERGCNGAPDWVIEVVSPSSRNMDYVIKLFKYKTAGVKEYWIVDPGFRKVRVYNFEGHGTYSEYDFEEPIQSGLYPDLIITINEFLS